MKAHVQKWGNSLAVRIPAALAQSAGIGKNTPVNISVVDGAIMIEPAPPAVTLDELLAGVTDDNIHDEISTGSAVGSESW